MTTNCYGCGHAPARHCPAEGCDVRGCACEEFVSRLWTRAEVLALMGRVKEACAQVVDGCAVDESPSAPNYLDDVADMLRAVDVSRLLDEEK